MLEETIKELCRLTKIPAKKVRLCDSKNDAHFENKYFMLHHYKTAELEGITISCINEGDVEADIITGLSDSTYFLEIEIKTYCITKIKKLAESINSDNKVFQRAKKYLAEKAFPCENPYDTQAIIPINDTEQKDAACFAYSLLSKYISNAISKRKKEEKARKKRSWKHGAVF